MEGLVAAVDWPVEGWYPASLQGRRRSRIRLLAGVSLSAVGRARFLARGLI